jgi:hypothetical protein
MNEVRVGSVVVFGLKWDVRWHDKIGLVLKIDEDGKTCTVFWSGDRKGFEIVPDMFIGLLKVIS